MADRDPGEAAAALGPALGHEFADPGTLRQALTHRSAGGANNERLEFLGDSALDLAVAELAFRCGPAASEEELTRARAALVRRETLAEVAREIGLGAHLVLGAGESKSGGRERESILAGAFEALAGALYLEGGMEAVRAMAGRLFAGRLERVLRDGAAKDPKTRLQELLQARGLGLPRYRIVETGGAEHRPRFLVECELGAADPAETFRGEGASRRQAEQRAAARALREIGDDDG